MDQDATWYGGRPRPRPHCARWGPSFSPKKGHSPPAQFSAHVCCGQTVAHLSYCWALVSAVLSKLKDFSRSQAVTYSVKVVICWKKWKIQTLLLQTTIRNWCVSCWIAPFLMTLSDVDSRSLIAVLFIWDFLSVVQQLTVRDGLASCVYKNIDFYFLQDVVSRWHLNVSIVTEY